MLLVSPVQLWRDIVCFQREAACETRMLESQRPLTTSPGMPRALAETLQDFAALHPKGGEKSKHINKLQAQYEIPKPIILSLREMKREVSPQGMTTGADSHSLPPVLVAPLHCCSSSNFTVLSLLSLM